tara:strand:+ start:2781 stop:3557 length:777 start_codon:yes stop_codon:yes gene_type:complete
MQKFLETDNANANGTSKDRDGVVAGTSVKSYFLNDNFFNLFEFLASQGYTLIDGDTSQLAKANKALYNATYIYNTSAIATQSVSDIVEGSDGYYYKVLSDATTGDNPVGSVTGSWEKILYDLDTISKSKISYDNDTASFISNTLTSGAIIEEGSNANGNHIKFANGTIILFREITADFTTASTTAQLFTLPSTILPTYSGISTYLTSLTADVPLQVSYSKSLRGAAFGLSSTAISVYPYDNTAGTSFSFNIQIISNWK